MRALALGLVGLIFVAYSASTTGCSSSSSNGDETCTNNGGVCNTSGKCGDELPYPCDLGGICCKAGTSSDTAAPH